MAGIAGIGRSGERALVEAMLEKMAHRGPAGREILELEDATLGLAWREEQADALVALREAGALIDFVAEGQLASVTRADGKLVLTRDPLGVAPLYYGRAEGGALCFASEVKGLLKATREVKELPPGCHFDGSLLRVYYSLRAQDSPGTQAETVARELKRRLVAAVERRLREGEVGSWLSGGLDSSTLAALARPRVKRLHTFSVGFAGAPDLEYAREVARFIGSEHHECVVTLPQLVEALPQVIYHLESFDALLVRSAATNYLLAKMASDYVREAFSGEAGDELFAGYAYLKLLEPEALPHELIDITSRLHNTAFQRVDRCAAAHGTGALVAFADPEVVAYALQIPHALKLRGGVEKWILRRAMEHELPESVLERTKAKFWEGAGVGELLSEHAAARISDHEFRKERSLPDGGELRSKEELLYYRLFRDCFGDDLDLSWVGRTKGAPGS